jgi:N6-L-threonylcarbamoyladenine synthase
LLGRTRDDAAGEAFDKIAKMIGLPYPGGPEIDKLARLGRGDAHAFPRSFLDGRSLEFSFSGLKTAVLYELPRLKLEDPAVLADVCASVQEAARCEQEGLTLLLARPDLSTDNAAMIAYAAAQRFKLGQTSALEADVDPNLPLVA